MTKHTPKVSIIIPLYKKTPYFYETVGRCLELDYPDFEILIGIDGETKVSFQDERIRILRTGEKNTGPAEKRDIGIEEAKGEIIALLDDDSYPEENWLARATQLLEDREVASVCGPGLTPPWDSFSQKLTGGILSSLFGSGPYYYRFDKGEPRYVDDYPAYNMIFWKKDLEEVGGFGTKFYGGEDTALCLKLIDAGKKIYYHPDIVVYHHRRHFPFEYMRQVGNVGLHRGYFVKEYPKTSLRITYFGPAIFTIGALLSALFSLMYPVILLIGLVVFAIFYAIILMESAKKNSLLVNIFLPFAIIVNYLAYGTKFIQGLVFTDRLTR